MENRPTKPCSPGGIPSTSTEADASQLPFFHVYSHIFGLHVLASSLRSGHQSWAWTLTWRLWDAPRRYYGKKRPPCHSPPKRPSLWPKSSWLHWTRQQLPVYLLRKSKALTDTSVLFSRAPSSRSPLDLSSLFFWIYFVKCTVSPCCIFSLSHSVLGRTRSSPISTKKQNQNKTQF